MSRLAFIQIAAIVAIVGTVLSCTAPTSTEENGQGIYGTVIDAETQKPVNGAIVETYPSTSTVTTGKDGGFAIADVSPASYEVRVRASGYDLFSTQIQVREGYSAWSDMVLLRHVENQAGSSGGASQAASSQSANSVAYFPTSSIAWSSILAQSSSSYVSTVRGATWKIVSNADLDMDFKGVAAVSGGYAWVISVDALVRCQGTKCAVDRTLPPMMSRVLGVDLLDSLHGFVLGERGIYNSEIFLGKWNGSSWKLDTVTNDRNGTCSGGANLAVENENDIWVSCGSEAWHYDGKEWATFVLPGTIYRIRHSGDGRAFALLRGQVCEYADDLWDCDFITIVDAETSYSWDFDYQRSTGTFWIASSLQIWFGYWDQLSLQTDQYGTDLTGGYAVSATDSMTFIGRKGAFFTHVEGLWALKEIPSIQVVYGIAMVDPGDGWAVGSSGLLLRWK